MSDNDPQPSPGPHDDSAGPNASGLAAGNGGVPNSNPNAAGVDPSRGVKRNRPNPDDDDDDEDNKPGRERRKIEIKFIQDKSRRHITFSKRKAGIMKKAYELSVLTGTQVLLLVVSETGLVYTFTTPKLQPLVTKAEGKNLIQACLNAPEPHSSENGVADGDSAGVDSPEEPQHTQLPPQVPGRTPVGMPVGPGVPPGPYMNMPDAATQAQAHAYQQYMQQQQAAAQAQVQAQRGGYLPQHPAQMQPHPAQTS
ncbi:SRF-TF-domain-containing protein [Tuber magnatum]|uniref:SRF-TF-domain-containing protein n=1 Tax=Tuber magnatum TaxID=42249 RepID=A0A317SVP4_9PEZI|nr:SRF-TF-domain-containing protein [Tuber magnatum]